MVAKQSSHFKDSSTTLGMTGKAKPCKEERRKKKEEWWWRSDASHY